MPLFPLPLDPVLVDPPVIGTAPDLLQMLKGPVPILLQYISFFHFIYGLWVIQWCPRYGYRPLVPNGLSLHL